MAPSNTKITEIYCARRGFALVEVLVAIAVFSIFATGVFYLSLDTLERDTRIQLENEGLLYAQEGLEAVRTVRDRNYLLLSSGNYGLSLSGDTWSLSTAPEDIDGFYSRTITVEEVYRDGAGDIAATGTLDPETKKITSTVSWLWRGLFAKSISLSTYLSNWTGEDWLQGTCTEFDAGTFSDTETLPEVGPPADNCTLQLIFTEGTGGFYGDLSIGDQGNDIAVDGSYAYLASNKVNQGLVIVDVADVENLGVTSYLDIGAKGLFIEKSGDYAFISTQKTSAGLVITNVSNPTSPSIASTLDIGDYGGHLAVSGNTLYMGDSGSNNLVVVDITNKSSPSIANRVDLGARVKSVRVSGNYAYVGLDSTSSGFKILDLSTPTNPTVVSSLNLGSGVNSIELNGNFVFAGELNGSSLFVVNSADPNAPTLLTSIEAPGELQDLVVQDGYLYGATDATNEGLVTIDIQTPSSPEIVEVRDILGKASGIDSDGTHVFVSMNINNHGLVIIGLVEMEYLPNGTYTSNVLDTGSVDTRYNFLEWDYTEAPGGTLTFQLRTASSSAGISSATWVGPDGTPSTYYETSRTAIELNPSSTGPRYFQLQALFTSDGASSPLLDSVRVNFNP